jgi:hypothetical protein
VVGYHSGPDSGVSICVQVTCNDQVSRLLFEGQNITLALVLGRHTMEGEGNTHREKRFKVRTPPIPSHTELSLGKQYQSYQATLKHVHLPSALTQSEFDHDIEVGI